jgi:holo-[acyl-carrier protein] synthase
MGKEKPRCGRVTRIADRHPAIGKSGNLMSGDRRFRFTDRPIPRFQDSFMIVGTGIDIVEVPRVAEAIERFGARFLARIFTDGEILYCQSKHNAVERFAARFAAKEAGLKAIGTGWRRGVAWKDVEVRREPGGRPTIAFSGKAAEFAAKLGVTRTSLSISHTKEHAIAEVILESEK